MWHTKASQQCRQMWSFHFVGRAQQSNPMPTVCLMFNSLLSTIFFPLYKRLLLPNEIWKFCSVGFVGLNLKKKGNFLMFTDIFTRLWLFNNLTIYPKSPQNKPLKQMSQQKKKIWLQLKEKSHICLLFYIRVVTILNFWVTIIVTGNIAILWLFTIIEFKEKNTEKLSKSPRKKKKCNLVLNVLKYCFNEQKGMMYRLFMYRPLKICILFGLLGAN